MNKTHRIVWSEARQGYVVAHENAAACGKPSSTRKGVVSAVAAALLALGAGQAQALSSCVGGGVLQTVSATGETNCTLAAGDSLTVTGSIADANVGVTVQAVTAGAIGVGPGASIIGGISGILLRSGGSVNGNIANSGTIQGTGSNGSGIALSNGNMTGDIVNNAVGTIHGTIHGASEAIYIAGATLTGNINNSGGTLSGNVKAISLTSGTIDGHITNSGVISGVNYGIAVGTTSAITGSITNSGLIDGVGGAGILVSTSSQVAGSLTNSGTIHGNATGIYIDGSSIGGSIINSGKIEGGTIKGIYINSSTIDAIINNASTNGGTIQGGSYGIYLTNSQLSAGLTNSGIIKGVDSDGIAIRTGSSITGGITNSGTISGFNSVRASNGGTLDHILITGDHAKFIGNVNASMADVVVDSAATYTMNNGNKFTVSAFTTAGTLGVAAGGTATVTGNYTQNSSGTFRTNVTNSTTYGKLTVSGSAGLPTAAQFDVVTGDAANCGGITAGTLAGVLKSGGAMTSTTFATVTDDCTNVNFTAVYNSGTSAIDLVAVAAGPSTWIVTGASGGNGTVSCDSPVTNNGYATCTGTASGGYSLASAAGCGTTTVSGNTITAGPVTAACTVTGTFAASGTYAVTAVANPVAGGSVSCTPASGIAFGGSSTCSRTANPGYTFTNWGGDCSSAGSSASCTITGITSAKSVTANFTAAVTPTVEPLMPEVPVVPLIPPLASLPALPGVGNSGRIFLNLSEGAGPVMTGCLGATLNALLGPDWQYQGQSADGGGRLKRATDIISFYPIEASTNTTYGLGQGAGLYLRGGNPMSVVTGCGTFVAAPALYNLGEFGAVLNADGQTAQINDQGVMTFPFGSLIYVVRPNYLVTQGTPGAPALSTGADGLLRFTDSAGHTQILYPAFLDPDLLGTQVSQAVGGWTVIQTDGTALLTLFGGQQFVLTPDLALGSVPPGTMTVWWQDGPNHYSYRNSGFSNTSQGFSVTPR